MPKKVMALVLAGVTLLTGVTAYAMPVSEDTEDAVHNTHNGIAEGDTIMGEITHYCVCERCCGKTDGVTASGFRIRNGMIDPHIVSCNWLPFGAVVEIDGQEYTVADRGGRGLNKVGRLDVYVPAGHKAARKLGRVRGTAITIVSLPNEE